MSMATDAAPLPPTGLRLSLTLALQGAILGTFFAASAAPTPLYRLYQEQWGFSPTMLTLVFASYAFGLLAALLTIGALSDHVGRRPVIFGALALELASMGLFFAAADVNHLILARLVQGYASGAATAAIGAGVIDCDRRVGPLVSSITPMVGMAIGALGTATLILYAPAPLHLVYALLGGLFALQAALIWATPETGPTKPGALGSLVPRVRVPVAARSMLLRVSAPNIALWSVGAFSLSLMPSLVKAATGITSPILGGLLVCALTLPGASAVLLMRPVAPPLGLRICSLLVAGGFLVILAGTHVGSAPVMVGGMLVTGFGFGGAFMNAVRLLVPLATPGERGMLLSAFYVESYLAFSVPALAAGALAHTLGLVVTADLYGAFIILLALTGALVRLP